jgi:hypothetical protein
LAEILHIIDIVWDLATSTGYTNFIV